MYWKPFLYQDLPRGVYKSSVLVCLYLFGPQGPLSRPHVTASGAEPTSENDMCFTSECVSTPVTWHECRWHEFFFDPFTCFADELL